MSTVEIYGIEFLKCEREECEWNIGHTPHDLNRHGLFFTSRSDVGVRVCNFGRKALAHGKDIDSGCPHKIELCSMLAGDDSSPESRFWGRIDPEVARRVLGGAAERRD